MVLDPGILGATSSKDSLFVQLNQSSSSADAHFGVQVWLYENWEVPHLTGRNSHSSSTKQVPYFPTDNAHLTYNAHPNLFYIPFEVQITRT